MRAVSQKRLFWGFIGLAILVFFSTDARATEPPNLYVSHNESYTTQGTTTQGLEDTLDCVMSEIITEERDFVPVLKCQFQHPGIVTYSLPLFADIDGDGETEVVAALENSPDGFAVIDPNTCQAEHIVAVNGDIAIKDGGPVLGDVDSDGYVDIFIELDTKIQRWEYNPSTGQIGMVWETPAWVATAERSHLDIWDINQDGTPEIIPNVGQMVNSVTGEVYPGALPLLHGQGKGVFAFTADADPGQAPQGQGNVELVYGTSIYRYDFINLEWVEVRSVPDFDWGFNANVSLADMDMDGDVDAVVSSWDWQGKALIWDLQTTELIGGGTFNYPGAWGSRPNIANMDQDPYPELVMTSRYKIFAVDDIVTTGSFGNILWLDETSDESGHTQITSFDFDGNGTYEAVYRDETRLRIFSGMGTGIPTNGYPSGPRILLDSGDDDLCRSFTGLEYPTIGDIDNDNEAEIVATCQQFVNIYESGSLPWGNASKIWNTQAFNVTNVNQDGTIPQFVTENYTLYNNFLAQVNTGPISDTIYAAIPDGYIEIESITNNCDGTVAFEVLVCNQGANSLPSGTPIAFYWSNPTQVSANLVYSTALEETLDVGNCIELNSSDIEAPAGEITLYGVVNDDGQQPMPYVLDHIDDGGSFPLTHINECDYTNNMADTTIIVGAGAEVILTEVICEGETYTVNGQEYTEAGTYTFVQDIGNGCEETTTIILEVHPAFETVHTITICEGESYGMANQEFATHGIHEIALQTVNGCDSLLVLELTVLPPAASAITATICEGEVYEFGGTTYTESGTYINEATNGNGCDNSQTLVLTVLPSANSALTATICEGEAYEFAGTSYTTTGTYVNNLSSINGCDSTQVLELTVLDAAETSITASICEGDTFTFGNSDYSENGVFWHTFSSANGCDSTVQLTLNVSERIQEELEVSICEGESYVFGDASYSTSGDYNFTFTAASGCDSTVALRLNVAEVSMHSFNTTICEGSTFEYEGNIYSEAGTYQLEYVTASGCDSLVMLVVEEQVAYQMEEEAVICAGESYHLGAGIYTSSGIYEEVLQTAAGCDSTVVLQLEVVEGYSELIEKRICNGEAVQLGRYSYNQSGIYEHQYTSATGCDSVITLDLTVLDNSWSAIEMTICEGEEAIINGEVIDSAGIYYENLTNVNGCDSLVEYIVEVLPQIDIFSTDAVICKGESVKLEAFGATSYKWDFSKDLSCLDCQSPIASPLQTTTYRFTALGCRDTEIEAFVTVEVSDIPEIDAGPDVTIAPGQSVDLIATTPGNMDQNVTWESNYEVICERCPEVTVFPERRTAYIASIQNEVGCVAKDTMNVTLRTECIADDFFVPNMITPNGDGANDFFNIQADADLQVKWLRIYNRWGEMVFSTNDLSKQWDGSFRGKPLNPGVYVYYLEVNCPGNKPYQKFGNITLIK